MRSKKLIIAAVLALVVLAGGIGGAVLAAGGEEGALDQDPREALLDRVLEIYEQQTGVAIDAEALKGAFEQACEEGRTEAMQTRLQALVDEGTMTQAEADEYLEWQQSKPDVAPGFGSPGRGGFRGPGGFGGSGRMAPPTR